MHEGCGEACAVLAPLNVECKDGGEVPALLCVASCVFFCFNNSEAKGWRLCLHTAPSPVPHDGQLAGTQLVGLGRVSGCHAATTGSTGDTLVRLPCEEQCQAGGVLGPQWFLERGEDGAALGGDAGGSSS